MTYWHGLAIGAFCAISYLVFASHHMAATLDEMNNRQKSVVVTQHKAITDTILQRFDRLETDLRR